MCKIRIMNRHSYIKFIEVFGPPKPTASLIVQIHHHLRARGALFIYSEPQKVNPDNGLIFAWKYHSSSCAPYDTNPKVCHYYTSAKPIAPRVRSQVSWSEADLQNMYGGDLSCMGRKPENTIWKFSPVFPWGKGRKISIVCGTREPRVGVSQHSRIKSVIYLCFYRVLSFFVAYFPRACANSRI